MNETTKLYAYRRQHGYERYLRGHGIDIGWGHDCLSPALFPGITAVDPYDRAQGDAHTCATIADGQYDFVYSSHCLEHLHNPWQAFAHWIRICKPRGYLVTAVPHEIFYEKCRWPSRFNRDHRWSWTLEWPSNLPRSIHVPTFVAQFMASVTLVQAQTVLEHFDFTRFKEDQTLGAGICQIEFVVQKH